MIFKLRVNPNLIKGFKIARALIVSQYALMLEYRAEIILWAISGLLPLIMLGLWSDSQAAQLSGISKQELNRYFLSAFVVRQFTAVWVMVIFEEDLVEGRLSPFLLQPVKPFWRYLSSHVAEQFSRIPIVIIILAIFFFFNPSSFWLPDPLDIFLGIIAMVFAFFARFIMHWMFAMICFFSERASAIERLLLIPYLFLSGLVAPLEIFPDPIRKFAMLTPFPYLLSYPSNIFAGNSENILLGILGLLFWFTLFLLVSNFAWKKGIRHYSAMGS
ncbi:ABC transporter permease [Prochlorococcus sp. MIT 1300]|uniref:ABC transporter permease n=1 Tax=Prochlorococcus sp. MIT 1300 TaxID=3096218 RepID=UPI002A76640C|nr:ABC-2 family transporter protein [Prochlorococcus sp. MIT 1300]